MKRPVIGARSSFTQSTMDCGRAHQLSSTRRSVRPEVTPFAPGDPLAAPRLGTSGWSCRRRRGPAVAGGREEREGDEFQNHSFTPTR